jgi:Kdo2-lipid IVA lauroyltransferase/acyltransferase
MLLFVLILTLKLLAKIPLTALRVLGSGAGWMVWLVSRKVRRTVAANLSQAGLLGVAGLSVRRVVQANVRGLLEMVWIWFTPAAALHSRCTFVDHTQHMLKPIIDNAQATIFLTPHLGCFEALAKWFSLQAPMTALYRRPNKSWLATLIESARNTPQLHMVTADAHGVRQGLRALKSGGIMGILPDQAPRQGEGMWLSWFGRDAYTITLPAKLHLSTDAPMVIFAALPIAGGWQIVCDPVDVPVGLSAAQITLHLNQALERMVLRDPLHYAWSYKRYKGSAI